MNLPREKSWFDRNWKWFVPVVCMGLLVAVVCFALGILTLVFGVMKSSDVYKDAVAMANESAAVEAALGGPLEEGLLITGNINVSGSSGQADLAIPISGPKGQGKLYVVASKSAGEWTYSTLVVGVEATGERINLLE